LDKFCTTSLKELGEVGSCLAGIENGIMTENCNKSTVVQLWTIPISKLDPVTVHGIADFIMFPYIFQKTTFSFYF